jgi:hypothetical protein
MHNVHTKFNKNLPVDKSGEEGGSAPHTKKIIAYKRVFVLVTLMSVKICQRIQYRDFMEGRN